MVTAAHDHPKQAAKFVANNERAKWHDQALWFVRAKRDKAAQTLPEWETLRQTASQIKMHMISRLAEYLEQFEENAKKLGGEERSRCLRAAACRDARPHDHARR